MSVGKTILSLFPRIFSVGRFEVRVYRQGVGLVGMTTPSEQLWFKKIAKEYAIRSGAIVDLGSWMGSTAIPLAQGLREGATEETPKRVQAIDRYVWEEWMRPFSSELHCDYIPGDSFLPEARKRFLAEGNIIPIQADLATYQWGGEEISILLIDAMKSVELAVAIATQFYPHINPGSCLIHQDYKHYYTPWIHVLQYRLRHKFLPFHDVIGSSSFAFKVRSKIERNELLQAASLDQVADGELASAIDYSLGLVENPGKANIAASHVKHVLNSGRVHEARELLENYSNQFGWSGELLVVSGLLDAHSGKRGKW